MRKRNCRSGDYIAILFFFSFVRSSVLARNCLFAVAIRFSSNKSAIKAFFFCLSNYGVCKFVFFFVSLLLKIEFALISDSLVDVMFLRGTIDDVILECQKYNVLGLPIVLWISYLILNGKKYLSTMIYSFLFIAFICFAV